MKKYLLMISIISSMFSYNLFAKINLGGGDGENTGVSFSGFMEADLMGRTNNLSKNGEAGTTSLMELDTVLEFSGKHDSELGFVVWKIASKVATDFRYDSFGLREAWGGLDGKYGIFRIGNQFSNMYLAMDYPYGAQGMGNLFGDMGAHEVQYSRAITYITPVVNNFKLMLQYDIGGYGTPTATPTEYVKSYAYEAMLNYTSTNLRVDTGYYASKNNGSLDVWADVFNGSLSKPASAIANLENDASVYLLSGIYKINNFDFTLAYKHNSWTGDTLSYSTDGTLSNDHALARIGYTFDKNNINLGYQYITESKDNSGVVYSSMQSINFQYNRTIATNTLAFIQIREQMYGDSGNKISTDGMLTTEKNVTRFLLGLWVGF